MSKSKIKKIVKNYKNKLQEDGLQFSAVYLFGSCVSGKNNKWSDIDVAVVIKSVGKNYWKNLLSYSRAGLAVDKRLETHVFGAKDFKNTSDPMVYEIRKTGIKV